MNWTKFSLTLFFLRAFLNNAEKILFECYASDPTYIITGLPDLKHREAISHVTFGRLS